MKNGMQEKHTIKVIRVVHEGKVYEAVQSYQGNGDPNWIFALSIWKPVLNK